jgi:hypothetical protein
MYVCVCLCFINIYLHGRAMRLVTGDRISPEATFAPVRSFTPQTSEPGFTGM